MTLSILKTENPTKSPLGRASWLTIALDTLIVDGINAVQITRLAKTLNVTRGSFYWHFKSRDDLLIAILKEWDATNNTHFDSSFNRCLTLDESVLNFFEIWVGGAPFSPPLDQAIRDWAQLDQGVLQSVRDQDNQRLLRISKIFQRFDYAPQDADVRARVLYFSQVGYTAINLGEAMGERLSLLAPYYTAYTGRDLDPEIAAKFTKKMQANT